MKKLLYILLAGFILTSCGDEDDDPVLPKERFIQTITILSVPPNNWDSFSGPDLMVKFGRSSKTAFEFETNESTDRTTLPVTLVFPSEVLISNEDWKMQLVDVDSPDADDIIYNFNFNPKTAGNNGVIQLLDATGQQVIMKVNYSEK